jgi:predicted nucleic-acid-binding protein
MGYLRGRIQKCQLPSVKLEAQKNDIIYVLTYIYNNYGCAIDLHKFKNELILQYSEFKCDLNDCFACQ